ncbi:helix-turn-helix domain-containing protein [Amycolatopsis sp. NPDC005232]|uniref:helix-turn-helix domain-containing protein n=1 Tax=Amycolatopsis sp. NPDC005232 TaxID=3157027 RepID=UPI0033B43CCE
MDATILPLDVPARHLYRIPEAMRLLSMSRSVIYEQLRAGRLFSVKEGRARLIPAIAIKQYVDQLISEAEVTGYGQTA